MTEGRLARVRDAERRRLVANLLRTTQPALQRARTAAAAVEHALAESEEKDAAGPAVAADELDALDEALAATVEQFRSMARGIHPTLLRDEGVLPALRALTRTLPVTVRITGDLGPRSDWPAEATVYYAAAAVVTVLAGRPEAEPVELHALRSDAVLRVGVSQLDRSIDAAHAVRTLLAADIERLSVLGGDAVIEHESDRLVIELWLHESL